MHDVARHLRIHGTVQGVGYRDAALRRAQALGLTGWVRNRRDGTVEAFVQGPAEAVDAMVAWARRGPAAARVSEVEATPVDPLPHPPPFEWRATE
ncbi:MAG: acylphosphatase [Burkholderiales bacterium]